jgi:hypothetical protein
MTIRDYIKDDVFGARAGEYGCLVIYDPRRHYRDIAFSLESSQCRVLDVSESVIERRERASQSLNDLTDGTIHSLILWVPKPRPASDEDRQQDPFGVFGLIGREFPSGDGDSFPSLCRKAKPDHVPEINRLFQEGHEPSFDTLDALDQGGSWPTLKTLLNAGSAREIVLGLLSPTEAQDAALKANSGWIGEGREFVSRVLGHKLRTRGQTRQAVAEELWRLILFSEFAFSIEEALPPTLETVARAGAEARELVFEVCDQLRKHEDHQHRYVEQALQIESAAELDLEQATRGLSRLGERDTFAFEERRFLNQFVAAALADRPEEARTIHRERRRSIWLRQGDRQSEWEVAERALDLLETAERLEAPKFPSLEAIIQAYAATWRELDRHQRELEQAINEWPQEDDGLGKLVARARGLYFQRIEALQAEFIRLVGQDGWPCTATGFLSSGKIFAREIAPALDAGKRVAYFLVDSLRYELAVELEKQLSEKHSTKLQPVCAQLPTYTEVGMASLMPDADAALQLVRKGDKLTTMLGEMVATTPAGRFAYLQSRKGDQCIDMELEDLFRHKTLKIPEKVRLLVVRTRDIDTIAHATPHQVLRVLPELVRQILRGAAKVEECGFQKLVIATDHGFILVPEQGAGNVDTKPPGEWLVEKTRCVLGRGEADASNIVFKKEQVGIRGDFTDYAVPRTLVPYVRGQLYYHEGLSLQEAVLPCISVELKSKRKVPREPRLYLSYKQGKADRISSRRPVLDLAWPEGELFTEDTGIEVAVEAISKGKVVGWVGSGATVNAATQGVRIAPGQITSFGLRMDDDFSGSFSVRVLDPATNKGLAEELSLKTAYFE